MMIVMRSALTFLAMMFAGLPSAAGALTLHTDYAVSIRGFPVGNATLTAEIAKNAYSIAFAGGVHGLARLFSDAETSAKASGRVGSERLEPQSYSHVWTEDNEAETVTMRFDRRGVTAIKLDPPQKHPERYVPLTPKTNADALDLVSAFVWPVSTFDPKLCERTLPLIDGRRRFDIALAFSRRELFTAPSGPAINTVVCSFRYRPVAGQRIGKSDQSIVDKGTAEVWMAPASSGFAAPVLVQLQTRAGRIVLRARDFRVE
jgi:hypothetical protein